jgi:hypothetical protein
MTPSMQCGSNKLKTKANGNGLRAWKSESDTDLRNYVFPIVNNQIKVLGLRDLRTEARKRAYLVESSVEDIGIARGNEAPLALNMIAPT